MPRWGDLRTRTLAAALLAPLALAGIWAGGALWAALVGLCVAGLAWEWVRLCGGSLRAWPGALLPVGALAASAAAVLGLGMVGLCILALAAVLAWRVGAPLPRFRLALGVVAIGMAGVALIWLRADPASGARNVLFLFLVVWASDIGAYLAGRAIGGPRLWPAVSPGKTWAGALGGLAAAVAVGLLAGLAMSKGGGSASAPAAAALLGLAAQGGDLLESWLKRRFGVKDSSGLIPGHGGLLDRLDGVLAAAPVAALLGLLLGPGVPVWEWRWEG